MDDILENLTFTEFFSELRSFHKNNNNQTEEYYRRVYVSLIVNKLLVFLGTA